MNPLDPDPQTRYETLTAMRGRCPVHELAPGHFMAVNHNSVSAGLRRINEFGGSAGQEGLPEDDTMIAAILEPRHTAIRRILNSVIAFNKSQQIEAYLAEFIGDRMREVMDAAKGVKPVEVMSLLIEPLPPAAMARLMGFPEADSGEYAKWGIHVGVAFGKAAALGRSISLREACPQLATYVEERISERKALPATEWPNDALTRFITTEVEGERLSTRSIVTQVMFAIGAGTETTRNVLGSLLFRLAGDAALYQQLRADRSLIEPVIEEALRIDSPAQFLVRRCLAEHADLGGEALAEGDIVLLSIASANRDNEVFNDSDSFDPKRTNLREHLGFGTGPHICPGASLARLELRLALVDWCDAVESFSVAPGFCWKPPGTGMLHGPATLELVLIASRDG